MPRPNLLAQFTLPEYDFETGAAGPNETPDLSVVVPVYDEVENLQQLHAQLNAALTKLELAYEIIYVDDGSKDGSFQLLKNIQRDDPNVWVIRFRRNFGQTAAFSAGFDLAHGAVVVTMDADLQNDPQDIGLLLAKIQEGYDV
ncbi:MAG TPA: glycosyltransferase family 2 protein, partial [Anaerolineales bacterium]|nr:glycosyltransferase family 2 protein [Anaerolineales bacterium]